ncbi:MAG: DUF5318 family protein [Microthrixaceae bacterium]
MPFPQPTSAGRPGGAPGSVDYRLDRRRVLRAWRNGEVGTDDICDAQRELLRVARDYSVAAGRPCPVCDERTLRNVRYLFGPRLGPAGRCVRSDREIERIVTRAGSYRYYLIEVCTGCRWNHLLGIFPVGPGRSG